MHEIELDAERQLVDQFLAEIMKQHPKATYGEMMIRSALEQGAVDTSTFGRFAKGSTSLRL